MKFRIPLFLLILALAASSTLTAHAGRCSNMTIKGTYASTIHATIFLQDGSTLLLDGLAKQSFDGDGHFTQVDAVAANEQHAAGLAPWLGQLFREPGLHRNFDHRNRGDARPAYAVYR